MSLTRRTTIAEKKALLAARADLDRARIMLAVYDIKAVVAPGANADRVARLRPAVALLVSLLGPTFGTRRVARWLRVAWLALAAFRIVRNWR